MAASTTPTDVAGVGTSSSHARFRALAAGSASATSASAQRRAVVVDDDGSVDEPQVGVGVPVGGAVRAAGLAAELVAEEPDPTRARTRTRRPARAGWACVGAGRRAPRRPDAPRIGRARTTPAAGAATVRCARRSWCRNRAANGPSVHAGDGPPRPGSSRGGSTVGQAGVEPHQRPRRPAPTTAARSGTGSSRRTSTRTPGSGVLRSAAIVHAAACEAPGASTHEAAVLARR